MVVGDLSRGHGAAMLLEGLHRYELTAAEIERIFERDVYQDVINSQAFQRLKKINFLGSLDYVVNPKGPKPNKRHTRYQHSLGVALLALQFSRDRALTADEESVCVVAALLHDIGHAPLSHSLERVFSTHFGVNHHLTSEAIIRGDVGIGKGLSKALVKHGLNPFEVLATLSGRSTGKYRELFNHCINIDTIEAINRSSTYLSSSRTSSAPSDVLLALMTLGDGGEEILDSFWKLKNWVYTYLIGSRRGVLADYVCADYMRRNIEEFQADDYFLTEAELRGRHPELFKLLADLSSDDVGGFISSAGEVPFFRRSFVIDYSVPLGTVFDLDRRYKQTKIPDSITVSPKKE